jgi:4-hydroxythreonine-4-phosphate dehydrogenase
MTRTPVAAPDKPAPLKRLLITPGEPAGIGPDLVISLAQAAHEQAWLVIADPALLAARARQLGLPLKLIETGLDQPPQPDAPGTLRVLPLPLAVPARPGVLDPDNAASLLQALDWAVDACLHGQADALVTGPLQKSLINEAGIPFSGHTEYLAERCGADLPVMMLVAGRLRVALLTTHLPLRAVADAVTAERLRSTLRIVHHDLQRRFGLATPCIRVCGLNPHAGEAGHLGREEIEILHPVIQALRGEGLGVEGPFPADTLFTPAALAGADAVLAMYHDQGLPVLKHAGFGEAVNLTLGLPLLRTSVDHGTALDLAGSGRAQTGSLAAALQLAGELA